MKKFRNIAVNNLQAIGRRPTECHELVRNNPIKVSVFNLMGAWMENVNQQAKVGYIKQIVAATHTLLNAITTNSQKKYEQSEYVNSY